MLWNLLGASVVLTQLQVISATTHFSLEARGTNADRSLPIYKNPHAAIEDRVNDLLPRMTVEEKVAQMYVYLLLSSPATLMYFGQNSG